MRKNNDQDTESGPETGTLPRSHFGLNRTRTTPQGRARRPTAFELIDEIIQDRKAFLDFVEIKYKVKLERLKPSQEHKRAGILADHARDKAQAEGYYRQCQGLKRVFQGANLFGNDEQLMYNLLTEQIGFLLVGDDAASRSTRPDRSDAGSGR